MTNILTNTINDLRGLKTNINPKVIFPNATINGGVDISIRNKPKVIFQQAYGTGIVLDHLVKGKLDSIYGLDGMTATSTKIRVFNDNNVFVETFDYDEFKLTSTTASWNSTTKLTFGSGQIAYVGPMFLDASSGQVVSWARLGTTESGTGTFLYELSANGGTTWTTCNDGNAVNFPITAQGSDLRARITLQSGTGVQIQELLCSYYFVGE